MCIGIYTALIALLLYYTDYHLTQYALSTSAGDNQWMVTALGWEMLPAIWPAILLAMVVSSAVTLFLSRRLAQR